MTTLSLKAFAHLALWGVATSSLCATGFAAERAPAGVAERSPARPLAIPAVEPVPDDGNLPLNSALFSGSLDYGDLARNGYVEREFYFSGRASTREQETGAVIKPDLPYASRLVIRMPVDPRRFSGNVVIEPFHGQMETAVMWMQMHRHIVESGDAWVGFTVKAYSLDMEPTSQYNIGGVPLLKAYDPQRYGRLNLEPDMRPLTAPPPPKTPPQAFDLMGQVAALFKTNAPSSPLRGFKVDRVYAVGNGMSGEVVSGFVRTSQDLAWRLPDDQPVIDGYIFNNSTRLPPRAPPGAALAMVRSEHEIERAAFLGFIGKNPDGASYRVYDVPGTAHLGTRDMTESGSGARQMSALLPKADANMPWSVDATHCPNLNDDPVDLFLSAILARMEQWGKSRQPLPPAPAVKTTPGNPGTPMGDPTSSGPFDPPAKVALVAHDPATGNVIGGVRMPWLEAPIALYLSSVASQAPDVVSVSQHPVDGWPRASKDIPVTAKPRHEGKCILENPRLTYDAAKLRGIYRNYADYVRRFEAAKSHAVENGWLLEEDARQLHPRGAPENFGGAPAATAP